MISKVFIFIFFFMVSFISGVTADTIHLMNGRSIEGLIIKESDEGIELDVGFGTIKFSRKEIKSIYRSNQEEAVLMRRKWRRQKKLAEKEQFKREQELKRAKRKKELQEKKELEEKPKEVKFSQTSEHIMVDTLLNNKVKSSLLLDTGASTILLSSHVAEKLGIKTSGAEKEPGKVKMVDGHEVDAIYIVLDSVNVQGIEAKDIPAVVLLDDSKMGPYDGLLGMSFLNKFNFQIDTVNKKLILERSR